MKLSGASSRRRTTFRIVRLLSCVLGAWVLWACGPVYIPVPPPGQVSFTSTPLTDAAGNIQTYWIAAGGPNGNAANATFFITDEQRGAGVITRARADGSFVSPPMEGTAGDQVGVYFQAVSGRDSATACLILGDGPVAARCQ
jgi:hypothetical protein